MTTEIKIYLGVGIVAIIAAVIFGFAHHERSVEHTADVAVDSKALAVRHTEVAAETAAINENAQKADLGADHDQQVIDAYRAAHPELPVRLCHSTGDSGQRVPKAGAADGSTTGSGAGSFAVPEVPAGTPGPDIRPGLDVLVRAAGRLDVLYADRQKRQ